MSEIAANVTALARGREAKSKQSLSAVQWGLLGYGILAIALCAGWLLRNVGLVNPEEGVGYWLGIVGGSLMLVVLLYPVVKKSKTLRRLGIGRHWFRIHMILGLVGPLLVLYHCNFQYHAINSTVALYSMLLVAGSGIIGRHFYARIHRGLYGKRATIEELRTEISDAVENSRGIAAIFPQSIQLLHAISEELLGDRFTRKIKIGRALSWTFKHYIVRLKLRLSIRRELRARSKESETIRGNAPELRKMANLYMRDQVTLLRRAAQLAFYERLFSLWHVLHMPLFILLIFSALAHVLAVHMY